MRWRSDDCASGLHDYCNPCLCECHGASLTLEQTIALYKALEHQYIDYENREAHSALSVLMEVAKRHELGAKSSGPA